MDDARTRLAATLGCAFELLRREARWLALADDVVAFAADDDAGWRRLESEAWLLDRWRAGGVPAPRVVKRDAVRGVQVRERVHGITGDPVESLIFGGVPPRAGARLDGAPLSPFGERLAESYGEIAARIRKAVSIADARAAGLGVTSRETLDVAAAIARLHETPGISEAAKVAGNRARGWLAELPEPDAVIHSDLHFHNMGLSDDGSIAGVFDLSDSGIDAAATELLYVHALGSRFVSIVVDAYGPIDLADVRRAHLRTALDHLVSYGPGTPRHESIVAWVTAAFERLA